MRIKKISLENVMPIEKFHVDDLSDLVVIAGQNGAGKTRLMKNLISKFENPQITNVNFEIEPTNDYERNLFTKGRLPQERCTIGTESKEDQGILHKIIREEKNRRNYYSSIIYFESDRSYINKSGMNFNFGYKTDPYDERVASSLTINGLKGRWNDTLNSIFKKVHMQDGEIAKKAWELQKSGMAAMPLDLEDPLDPFKRVFFELLGPKELDSVDLPEQKLMYRINDNLLSIDTLSSGEIEALRLAFDFLLRNPSDCIVFIDEPELHLHPELLRRLISSLRSIGNNNQIFLVSHSPEIISSSLEDTVIFIKSKSEEGENQAILLRKDQQDSDLIQDLGQSIGVISLGKKIVVIEGDDASLDKFTYMSLLKNRFPNLVLLPGGGRESVQKLDRVTNKLISKAIWSVEFYMLADRDAFFDTSGQTKNFKLLPRYHLENYFLDSSVIAECFREMEGAGSWLCDPEKIEIKLQEIASKQISYAVALVAAAYFRKKVGDISLMPKGCDKLYKEDLITAISTRTSSELNKISSHLSQLDVIDFVGKKYDEFQSKIDSGSADWRYEFPCKQIFRTFCGLVNMPEGRMKNLYLKRIDEVNPHPMQEIIDIFAEFSK